MMLWNSPLTNPTDGIRSHGILANFIRHLSVLVREELVCLAKCRYFALNVLGTGLGAHLQSRHTT